MKVQLTKSGLIADLDSGMKRKEIAEKYGLPVGQINRAMSKVGLKGKRPSMDKFEIIDDERETPSGVVQPPQEFNEIYNDVSLDESN